MSDRPGCVSGLLKLLVLDWVFDFLQSKFGFGQGCSCTGCGCGCLLFILSTGLFCSIVTGTDWLKLGGQWLGFF